MYAGTDYRDMQTQITRIYRQSIGIRVHACTVDTDYRDIQRQYRNTCMYVCKHLVEIYTGICRHRIQVSRHRIQGYAGTEYRDKLAQNTGICRHRIQEE